MKSAVQDLLNQLDLDKVQEVIHSSGIESWDVDSIVQRVLLACDLWLLDDLKAGKILVEQEYDNKSKGILDLILIPDKDGTCGIVDWKTAGSVSRPNFISETKAEFQSSLYLAHGGDWIEQQYGVRPEYIEYRALDESGDVKTFKVYSTARNKEDVDFQCESVEHTYIALAGNFSQENGSPQTPWPRNRPRACFIGSKNGPTCPFYKDCCDMTMPRGLGGKSSEELYQLRPRSKSSMKTFLQCPELFRRTKILGVVGESNAAMNAGEAFHSAMECIYNQAIAVYGKT